MRRWSYSPIDLLLPACVAWLLAPSAAHAQRSERPAPPTLHHVGLNSADPERAIAWYLRVWPAARRTTFADLPAVQGEMLLHFTKVDRPLAGQWSESLHRATPQSAFWHIGAFTNTTDIDARMGAVGVSMLPLFIAPDDTVGVSRSGLAPYAGTLTASQIAAAPPAAPREGGFSYVLAPDGVLFELTGGPTTKDAFNHVHFFREHPLCSANWYAEHLAMELPPVRDSAGRETPRSAHAPCQVPYGEPGWPSLERIGTIRSPAGSVRHGNGTMSWYPRQCSAARCNGEDRLVPSRGQPLDHVAFSVTGLDAWYTRLQKAGVTILERPHALGAGRAFLFQDPDGLAVELVEGV